MSSAYIHTDAESGARPSLDDENSPAREDPLTPGPEARRPWTERLVKAPARFAFDLNERFVTLARRADDLMRRAERTVTQKLSPGRDVVAEAETARRDRLSRWARVRLSELHLRVGQSLYQLEEAPEKGESEREAVRRQLLALLTEIDRLEEILSRAGSKPIAGPLASEVGQTDRLFSQLEVELEGEAEGS